MKIVAYIDGDTRGLGALLPDGSIAPLPWPDFDSLMAEADPLAAVLAVDISNIERRAPARLLPPTVSRPQVIGTGGNYPEHAREASKAISASEPIFISFLWGAIIGPNDEIRIPEPTTLTDYEAEFSAVIGKTARRLDPENAMDHIFGFTIVNDVSARDVAERELFQIMLSKSPDTFLPVGPCVVTADEIIDPYALGIRSYLNGELRQDSITGRMGTRLPELLTVLTASVTLHPGDILTTGTPEGVGYFRNPPEFIRPGDTVCVEVDGIGRMCNTAVAGLPVGAR